MGSPAQKINMTYNKYEKMLSSGSRLGFLKGIFNLVCVIFLRLFEASASQLIKKDWELQERK